MQKLKSQPRLHHRGRVFQVPIYFMKLLRSFVYMNDWKMLPMAAVIAALVSMVVRKDFFLTMEGTVKGAFALTCVAIWNGCFNSIQVICRERPIVKREHRSGMHVASYVTAHMLYQALLCLAQTAVTLWVCSLVGVKFIKNGLITGVGIIDIGVTVFLITYASDMISLFISSVAHSTTSAMTVMPFILIFQLVFSGGIFTLPAWTDSVSNFTISRYGMQCVAAQAEYNSLPMVTGWNTLLKVEDRQITGTITIGKLLDIADENGLMASTREQVLADADTIAAALNASPTQMAAEIAMAYEISEVSPEAAQLASKLIEVAQAHNGLLVGDLIDAVSDFPLTQEIRNTEIPYNFTLRSLIDSYGRENLEHVVKSGNAAAMRNENYASNASHIAECWASLLMFAAFFAICTMVSLKFIDKDKR